MNRKLLAISLSLIAAFYCNAQGNEDISSTLHDNSAKSHHINIKYGGNVELSHCFYWKDFLRTTSGQASVTTTHGVHINQNVFVGLGTGFVFFYGHDWIGAHIPIFADAKYTFHTGKWRPFTDFKLGYAWGSECGLAQPAVGIKYAFKEKLGIYLSAGTSVYFAGYIDHGLWCNGLNLSLGLDF